MYNRTLKKALPIPALICLALIVLGPYVCSMYLVNLLIKAFFFTVAAIAVDILWGYTGYLTFGQSAFFGIGAYCAGLVFTHLGFTDGNIALALALALVLPAALSFFVGWLSFYRGASEFFPCVISLVVPIVVMQLVLSGGEFTGSSSGLTGFDTFEFDMDGWFWLSGGFMLAVAMAAHFFLQSDGGKVLVAIRDNEQRCAYLGLNPERIKILLMTVLGAVTGLAGFGYASFSGVVAPELTGFQFGTELIMWVALSGRATLWGPVLGTLLINVATGYLSSSIPFVWQLILGLSFILVIILLPKGLIPLIFRQLGKASPLVPELQAAQISAPYSGAHALDMQKVAKSYGSLSVLSDITLTGDQGELIGIIGPNGAGKTTLMRCMSDGTARTSGLVSLCGHDIGKAAPQKCVGFGLGRKFQNANIFQTLTVAQCLRMARFIVEKPSFLHESSVLKLPQYVLDVLKVTGLDGKLSAVASDLSHGEQQALELTMVLALEPKVVLLDEPTAGLTLPERRGIGKIFSDLAHKYSLCCLLVEHDLDFVKEVATRIVVLHHGTIVMQGTPEEVVNSELVQTIYAGARQA